MSDLSSPLPLEEDDSALQMELINIKFQIEEAKQDVLSKFAELEKRVLELGSSKQNVLAEDGDLKSHEAKGIAARNLEAAIKSPILAPMKEEPSGGVNVAHSVHADSIDPSSAKMATPRKKPRLTSEGSALPMMKIEKKPLTESLSEQCVRFGPIGEAMALLLKTYGHYQTQGKGPVFLLSLTGLLAMVLGVIYLLQESFQNVLDATGKLSLVGALGSACIALGYHLNRRREQMEDYGSVMAGLGILLFQITVFFAGPYYTLWEPEQCLLALLGVSCFAFVLTMFMNSRVVPCVALLGSMLVPLALPNGPWYHSHLIIYLCCQSFVGVGIAWRLKWRTYHLSNQVLATAMLEWVFIQTPMSSALEWSFITLQAFFFVMGVCSFSLLGHLKSLDKSLMGAQIANLILLLFTFQNVEISNFLHAVILFGHGAFWALVFYGVRAKCLGFREEAKAWLLPLSAIQVAVFLGAGLMTLVFSQWVGPLWMLEAMLLLVLGQKLSMSSLRKESLLVFSAALGYTVWDMFTTLDLPRKPEAFGALWQSWIMMTGGWWLFMACLKRGEQEWTPFESFFFTLFNKAFCVILSLAYFATVASCDSSYVLVSSPLILFVLLLRCQHKSGDRFLEVFALLHLSLPCLQIYWSQENVGSFSFGQQDIQGQMARVELFVLLWLLPQFYAQRLPQGRLQGLVNFGRRLFWILIPMLWLPRLYRSYPEYLSLGLWASTLVGVLISCVQRHWSIRTVTQALGLLAMLSCFVCVNFGVSSSGIHVVWSFQTPLFLLNIMVGMTLSLSLHVLVKSWRRPHARLRPELIKACAILIPISHLYFSISIAFLMLSQEQPLLRVFAMMSFVSYGYLSFWRKCHSLRPVLLPFWLMLFWLPMSFIFPFDLGVSPIEQQCIVVMYMGVMACLLHGSNRTWSVLFKTHGGLTFHLWAWNLLLALCIQLFVRHWWPEGIRVGSSLLLIFHASILLILTLKPPYKGCHALPITLFSVAALKLWLLDLVGTSMAQKTLVFLGMGLLLLGAAFLYQRLMSGSSKVGIGNAE